MIAISKPVEVVETFRTARRRDGDVHVVADGEATLGQRFRVVRRFGSGHGCSDLPHAVVVDVAVGPARRAPPTRHR